MFSGNRSGRPSLFVVPSTQPETGPAVTFCSHCGERPGWSHLAEAPSRVCEQCGLGLLLEAPGDAAPYPGDAFVVLDGSLSICAVSEAAEHLLGTRETDAVNRHVTEFIVPADAEAQGAANLAAAVTWAARGDETARTVTVRPTNTFGIRISARIGGCGPPRAALVVFDRRAAARPVAGARAASISPRRRPPVAGARGVRFVPPPPLSCACTSTPKLHAHVRPLRRP